jgi:dihydrofolate synthase/folylpolyglutamate synthase
MNYRETLEYLLMQLPLYQRIGQQAFRSDLENTYKLDAYFNNPHRCFKTIHVAGTNGKGSVSHMIASVFQEAGYRVGLYTSPHLLDFRERIKVNGKMVDKKFVMDFVKDHKPFFDTFNPSFFEISVFLAFCYFVRCKIDIAVIEVGLGGRLDATNIITPVLSVITNIGKDHTEILGDTIEKIAAEKAGIIKNKIPVVIGESQPETLPVFRQCSIRTRSPMYVADEIYKISSNLTSTDGYQIFNVMKENIYHFTNLKCGLLGHYQRMNTVTALATIEQLQVAGLHINNRNIYSGIRKVIVNTGLLGRWQIIGHNPTIVCDTGHNADGLKQVFLQVAITPYKNLHLILGFVSDKNIHEILKYLPLHASYYFTRLSVPRTMDQSVLASVAKEFGLNGPSFNGVKNAFAAAIKNAEVDDLIIITGSTFLVGDFLRLAKEANNSYINKK